MIKDLQTAKAQIKPSLLMSMESSGSRAEKLVNNISTLGRVISDGDIQSLNTTINYIDQF